MADQKASRCRSRREKGRAHGSTLRRNERWRGRKWPKRGNALFSHAAFCNAVEGIAGSRLKGQRGREKGKKQEKHATARKGVESDRAMDRERKSQRDRKMPPLPPRCWGDKKKRSVPSEQIRLNPSFLCWHPSDRREEHLALTHELEMVTNCYLLLKPALSSKENDESTKRLSAVEDLSDDAVSKSRWCWMR